MKNFTLVLCMLAISSLSFAQDCPVINATAVNSNGPGTYAITVNYSADPGINHINMVSFCATNPLTSLFTTECIEVNGSGTTVVNVSCTSTPVVILVPAPGACGTGFPCGLPTFVFGPVGGPLPIKMNSFFATRIGTQVNLSWNTEVEINAKEFVVERKTNGDFQPVATVTATNITEGSKYTFSDRNMEAGVSQYRIKMIDLDGTYRYSEIRAVKGSGTKADSVLMLSPRKASTLSMPRNCRSISAFSVSSRVKPPQIICGTASTLYLFMMAAQIPTVPGRLRMLTFSR